MTIKLPYAEDVNYCTLPIKDGIVAIIDLEDADLAEYKWSFQRGYVMRQFTQDDGSRRGVRIHRLILERVIGRPLLPSEYGDHENGDKLNNRRLNLRVATYGQNSSNQALHKDNTSGYKGVCFQNGRWKAQIRSKGTLIHLGYFDTPKAAHEAYKEAALLYHGTFARFE